MEAAGYIKYDFLGLSNVSKISKCLDLIEARYGERLDLRKIPKDDPEALVQFRKKRLATIFQFNKPHIPGIIDDVVIDDFSDIVVINALNRPGPMRYISRRIYEQERSNNLDLEEWQPGITYAENKKNRANIKYVTEDLRPILEQTYGINCYQEQIMEISQKIAGFTMQEADVLRKAIGKKIGSLFEECKEKFFKGARKNGYEDSVIQKIWQQAEDFASYSFNKSHSAAYGLIAYWNAWLLAHFPYEFYAACINEDAKDTKEILLFIKEAITFKPQINIIPPNVNESTYECYVKYSKNGPEAIVLPLTIIKGLGKNVEDIVANRPYKTFNSFCVRNNISASMFLTLLNSYEMFRGDDRKYRIDPLYTATGAFSCFSLNVSQLKIKFREAEEEIKENKKTSKANLEKGISPDLLSLFDVKEKVNSIEMDRKVKKDNLPI
jgi:DNA polymerase-3 subunit alpha